MKFAFILLGALQNLRRRHHHQSSLLSVWVAWVGVPLLLQMTIVNVDVWV